MRNTTGTIFLLAAISATTVLGQTNQNASSKNYPAELPGAKVEVYKTVGDVQLNIYIYTPPGHQPSDQAAAVVFFFGGGWKGGTPGQFQHQCERLAARGMVAMTADYRVLGRHGTPASKCVADAKSAVRWIRANAERLGIDPNRVAAGGGSAGGHLAACTGTIAGFDESGEDLAISSIPDAMVLFNPAVVLAPVDDTSPLDPERMAGLEERMGTKPIDLSPYHHVKKGAPPAILFHGTADSTVPFATAQLFAEAMAAAGNRCELVPFEGQGHGFFNHGRDGNEAFEKTLEAADAFFVELGFLSKK